MASWKNGAMVAAVALTVVAAVLCAGAAEASSSSGVRRALAGVDGTAVLGEDAAPPPPEVAPVYTGMPWWAIPVAAGAAALAILLYFVGKLVVNRLRA